MQLSWILRRIVADAETHPVSAFLVDVQVERHARLAERRGELQAVLYRNSTVFERMPDETRRRVRPHLKFIGQLPYQVGGWIRAEETVPGT